MSLAAPGSERSQNHVPEQQKLVAHMFIVRCHVDTFLADDGDRVWVSCSNRDGSVSAVAQRQVVMDCDDHTSRNTLRSGQLSLPTCEYDSNTGAPTRNMGTTP